MLPNLYSSTDPVEFLSDVFSAPVRANPRYFLRSWARQLRLLSPSLLSRIRARKKAITPRMTEVLSRHLRLGAQKRFYFEMMILSRGTLRAIESLAESLSPVELVTVGLSKADAARAVAYFEDCMIKLRGFR